MAMEKTKINKDNPEDILKKIDKKTRKGDEHTFMRQLAQRIGGTEWDEIPDKPPSIAVEYCGLQGSGKTHYAGTFPSPALLDTEDKGDVVWKKFGHKYLKKATKFEDVVAFVNTVTSDPDILTGVFDSSRDICDFTERFTCAQLERQKLFSDGGQVLYSHMYEKLDWIISSLRAAKKNVVFTSRMKDEYVGKNKTGNIIRDGYKKAPYKFDFVIILTDQIVWKDKSYFLEAIIGQVFKNGQVRRRYRKPYILDPTYEGIMNDLMKPVDEPNKYMGSVIKELLDQGLAYEVKV